MTVWPNIFKFIVLHGLALYALTLLPGVCLATWAWLIGSYIFAGLYIVPIMPPDPDIMSGLGITAGAHRLWSHRTYKARLPLKLVLMLANTMAGENSIYTWTRDHRTHHKFSETHGDPHNAKVRQETILTTLSLYLSVTEGLLLLAHGLAVCQEAPSCHQGWAHHLHG